MALRGFINVNKPVGMTSNDVVVKVRGMLRAATKDKKIKVGHLGTLDPQASGVLPISVGSATKLFDFLSEKSKKYVAEFTFGETTETLDREGQISDSNGIVPSIEQVNSALSALTGCIEQKPPAFSAVYVDGVKAYKLARQGDLRDLPARKITIYQFACIGQINQKSFRFGIECSSGTYIRALARDLASELGTIGYMSALERVQSGRFCIDDAVNLQTLNQNPLEYVIPIEQIIDEDVFEMPESLAKKLLNGLSAECDNLPDKDCFAVKLNNQIIAIGTKDNQNALRLKTRL